MSLDFKVSVSEEEDAMKVCHIYHITRAPYNTPTVTRLIR